MVILFHVYLEKYQQNYIFGKGLRQIVERSPLSLRGRFVPCWPAVFVSYIPIKPLDTKPGRSWCSPQGL